ncbi:hypothetical protein V3C99_000340 [Haemonchus contortus]|nr:unnamed protein product [Haemonchus contortus]
MVYFVPVLQGQFLRAYSGFSRKIRRSMSFSMTKPSHKSEMKNFSNRSYLGRPSLNKQGDGSVMAVVLQRQRVTF